ncbi:exosortase Y-associated Wzy-like protein [Pedobacter sp. JCM 36344]|uniref:exosortase Y-associated Wzy-like protein n=1 Tax=Pedobacter sp. JCM 36344 TaxID=3374280 RepID=UPI0039782CAD
MNYKTKIISLVYMPCLLSLIFTFDPTISFFIAWFGSFYIFYITIFSSLAPLRTSKNGTVPVMKPIILIQIIFAGFMCCTSIFYFLEHSDGEVNLISYCQRLSLLAHSSMVSGMILTIRSEKKVNKVTFNPSLNLILSICLISYLSAKSLNYLAPLIQFKYPLQVLSITSAVYLFVKAAAAKHFIHILVGLSIFGIHFIESTLTGFKEGVIVQILTLAFVAFHYYRKVVLITTFPILLFSLYVLPTYTTIMRAESWKNGKSMSSARLQAYETFFNDESEYLIIENNWMFLTNRFSEIGMFVKYIKHTPDHRDFIGLEILGNVLDSLIPRFLWVNKPITEDVAMRRVYDAGVANRSSEVSAKTRPVVDGYLIAGATGVFLVMLGYGMITQIISNTAEKLFGGYELGGILIFNSLFQQLWRGNTFEFLINNVIYGFLLMLIIYAMMNVMNVFSVITQNENNTN